MGLFKKLFGKKDPKLDFVDRVLNTLPDGVRKTIHFDEPGFCLTFPNQKDRVVYLYNIFQDYRGATDARAKAVVIENIQSLLAQNPDEVKLSPEEVRACLLPAVREKNYFSMMELQMECEGRKVPEVPYRSLSENLLVHVVIDMPTSMQFGTAQELEKAGLDFDSALEIAIQNLEGLTGDGFVEIANGVYTGPWEDCYVPSRLVLPELFRSLPLKGKPVAVAANRNRMFITGSQDIAGLTKMLDLLKEALSEPRPMTPRLLILGEAGWKNWDPQHDTPIFDEFRRLKVQADGGDYNEQQAWLDKLHAKQGRDVFVATVGSIGEKDTGRLQTYAVWTKTVPTLLPETDLIVFIDPELPEGARTACMADWHKVYDRLGHVMVPQGMFPERYLVTGFPEVSLLQELNIQSD